MLRKILFQAHWIVGITLGAVLSMSGITGGLMAFDPEICNFFLGYYQPVAPQRGNMLSVTALYARVHTLNPDRVVLVLRPAADSKHAAQVEFAAAEAVARGGFDLNSDDDRKNRRLIDPYSGALLPESGASKHLQAFMARLRQLHQGHWFPPGHPVGDIIYRSVGIAAVFLFGMALSGLYLRWPRGRAVRSWRSWFKINMRLKGRAFLWNLHAVMGTVVLVAYLISAHSGAFKSGTVAWYGTTVRALIGAPPLTFPGGGADKPPPPPPRAPAALDESGLWSAFINEVPTFKSAAMQITQSPAQAARFVYTASGSGAIGQVDVDLMAATVRYTPPGHVPPLSFAEFVVQKNQDIHEGRIFGKPGAAVMMLAAFAMPVFYVTGWMMYVKRRNRKRAAKAAARLGEPHREGALSGKSCHTDGVAAREGVSDRDSLLR